MSSSVLVLSIVEDCFVAQSIWAEDSLEASQESGFLSAISTSMNKGNVEKEKQQVVMMESSAPPTRPQVPMQTLKLWKFVTVPR